jgi:Domain of unknown function (DUF4265)
MDLVKVRFAIEQDEDGWPPVGSEGLWAESLGHARYRLDNTPWFVRGVASDDIVAAIADPDDVLWFTERVEWSGRLTIRVIPFRAGPLAGSLRAVVEIFEELGVSGEGALPAYAIVALDVPADADFAAVKARLRRGEDDGSWSYEEAASTTVGSPSEARPRGRLMRPRGPRRSGRRWCSRLRWGRTCRSGCARPA